MSIYFKMQNIKRCSFIFWAVIGILFFIVLPGKAHAVCGFASGTSYQTKYYNFGNVIVQRDAPIGTVVASLNTGSFSDGTTLFGCEDPWTYRWELSQFMTPSGIQDVYQTNVPGIGIRIKNLGSGRVFPYDQAVAGLVYAKIIDGIVAELVKTGVVQAGAITGGTLARASIAGVMYTEEVDMGSNAIIPVACSIQTPTLNFPIGNVLAVNFGSSVGTIPAGAQNSQNLGLSCDAGANINVMLQGTQNPDVADTSVLALTGQGSAGVASGVGVQLLYNSSPLVLNNNIVLKQSAGGQETFPITARYYQTKTAVTTGTANASAILTLTYQ